MYVSVFFSFLKMPGSSEVCSCLLELLPIDIFGVPPGFIRGSLRRCHRRSIANPHVSVFLIFHMAEKQPVQAKTDIFLLCSSRGEDGDGARRFFFTVFRRVSRVDYNIPSHPLISARL
ncbi:unnamed protein product [Amoebophrya sp. A25]|nr:unnamed protein product [Amoebophrya sp. A25]|eukprot:GSA25T00007587001.1